MPEPIAQSVAEDGTGNRNGADNPGIERLQPDEHPADEDDGAAGYDRANDRERLEQRRHEHCAERKLRVRGKIIDQRLQVRFQAGKPSRSCAVYSGAGEPSAQDGSSSARPWLAITRA